VALLGRQREIFKMGLPVVARIYPYNHARAPSQREIIVYAKAYSVPSPATKPLASLLRTLPREGTESMKLNVVRSLLIDVHINGPCRKPPVLD
jgi:hypothetical protein